MTKEQKNMLALYIGFFISTILEFVPVDVIQIFGTLFFLVLLISTYIYRSTSKENNLQKTHIQYIIKTIWIFSLFLFIGIAAAGLLADNSSINTAMDKVMSGNIMSESELESILTAYMKNNVFIFTVTIGPSFLYFFYRLFIGATLVRQNNTVTNLKNWF